MTTRYRKVGKDDAVGLETLAKSIRRIEGKVREIESQLEDACRLLREIHEAMSTGIDSNWQDLYENGHDYPWSQEFS